MSVAERNSRMRSMSMCIAMASTMILGLSGARAQTQIPPSPQDFVQAAAQSDNYEIMAAHLAEVQGQDPRVRSFAQRMIADHTQLSQKLGQAAADSKLEPPTSGMSSDQAMLLSGLQGLRGAAFDKAYARQQELAHAQAVAVEDSFSSAGADPNLKAAAKAALPVISDHLEMARQLREQVDGS